MRFFILSLVSIVILNGCSFRGFQPPPDTWQNFYKPPQKNVSFEIIKKDMKECGFTDIFKSTDMADNEYVESQICMSKKGYKNYAYKEGICNDSYFGKYCL